MKIRSMKVEMGEVEEKEGGKYWGKETGRRVRVANGKYILHVLPKGA